MKKFAKNSLTIASVSVALALSAGAMADEKQNKHYGDEYFNGQYDDRYDRNHYDRRDSRYRDYRDERRYSGYGKIVRAKVTDVDPVYRTVRGEPIAQEQCWREPRRVSRSDRRAGSVIGAVIGGVIGYKVGGDHRHNKRSGAAVGAVLGSVIGGEAAKNKHRSERRYESHCETVYTGGYERQQLIGYNVEYKYKGQRFETFMDYEPGRYINVRLSAEPVGRR
ncbi:MAG: glycine zipper 2TM domain-containing protein [Gammaproteobacteria bacterium]|nr:glycine zipper 2TM domain-containing protein [Gammaproteobacteria bacterium]